MASLAEVMERDCVVVIESTIPMGLTIADWRRAQARGRLGTRRGFRGLRVRAARQR
jgi:hypothetical protein